MAKPPPSQVRDPAPGPESGPGPDSLAHPVSSPGSDSSTTRLRHVVGFGASAGGLEALKQLVGQLTTAGSVSYVVAQHLAPDHPSLIVELLAHATTLPVVAAVDGECLRPGVIVVVPPNRDLRLEGDRLRLLDPQPRFAPSPCIDLLFDSIAEHWGASGVAVVLSGTGSDGARGLLAVRASGGLTLAQTPETARFDGMPRSAIHLGGADLVLDPVAIGQLLASRIAVGGGLAGGGRTGGAGFPGADSAHVAAGQWHRFQPVQGFHPAPSASAADGDPPAHGSGGLSGPVAERS